MRKGEEEQVNSRTRRGQVERTGRVGFIKDTARRALLCISHSCLFSITLGFLMIGFYFPGTNQLAHSAESKAEQKKAEPQKTETMPAKVETPPKFNVADFVYLSEGRRDPFQSLPLVRLKETKTKKTVKKGYELEELKIVGLLKTDTKKYVMMEDVQGRGITFQKGDYLNTNLWVADVLDGNVVFAYKLKEEIKKFTVDVPRK